MNTSYPTKALMLAGALLRHPTHVPVWLTTLPCWGRRPMDVELPWFSNGAINYLKRAVRPEHEVFEFGSGGSSVFFARRTRSVRSVENDAAWYRLVTERTAALGLGNFRCELHPFGDDDVARHQELSYFSAIVGHTYDIVVVDGFCGFTANTYGPLRPHAFDLALAAVRRPGGMIVVDDYWMYPELTARASGSQVHVFESTGPCRYGVTSTAVFQF